jgi:hypothetical protein
LSRCRRAALRSLPRILTAFRDPRLHSLREMLRPVPTLVNTACRRRVGRICQTWGDALPTYVCRGVDSPSAQVVRPGIRCCNASPFLSAQTCLEENDLYSPRNPLHSCCELRLRSAMQPSSRSYREYPPPISNGHAKLMVFAFRRRSSGPRQLAPSPLQPHSGLVPPR